jgi:hypothetical protein
MTKLTPKKKAKRQEVRGKRKAAKKQRKDLRDQTRTEFGDGLYRLDQRNEPEDVNKAAARNVRELTKGK